MEAKRINDVDMETKEKTYAQEVIRKRIVEKLEICQTESFQFHNSDNHSDYSDYSDYYVYGDSDYSISIM